MKKRKHIAYVGSQIIVCLAVMIAVSIVSVTLKHKGVISFEASISFVAISAVVLSSALAVYASVYSSRKTSKECDILKVEIQAISEYYSETEKNIEEIYKLRHEIKNYMNLLNLGEEFDSVTKTLENRTQNLIGERLCENQILNIILNKMHCICTQNNIKFSSAVLISNDLSIDYLDLCSCFYNLIDNAIYANCNNNGTDNSFVSVKASVIGNFLVIKQSNSYFNKIEKNLRGEYITSKASRDGHGYGIKIIEDICRKYDGYCEFEAKDGVFYSTVGLNLVNK